MKLQQTPRFPAAAVLTALIVFTPAAAQTVSPADLLYREAQHKQQVEGDLTGAIKLYKQIAATKNGDRAVIAKALLGLADCYEKLGQPPEPVYQQIVSEFGDQPAAAQARTKLSALRVSRARWAENVALPEAQRLRDHFQLLAALRLLQQAEQYVPTSSRVIQLKEDLPPWSSAIDTMPEGADVFVIDYANPKDGDTDQWEHLGRSPLKTDRLPRDGYFRLRVVKDGFETVEWATAARHTIQIQLHTHEETPPGMVWIPGPPSAWLDKYEVSNRQFKEFVDAGGYRKQQYWKEPFVKDGKTLTWEQAMAEFRDATGGTGPATWQAGSYPDGKADFPVGGVSWYEAAAFAEFAGKSLPTISHWRAAAGSASMNSQILLFSNFGGQGPARSGSNRGLAPFGAYDMAGNVKEWVWNSSAEKRFILGGGWNEPNYMFRQPDALPPFARDASFGFRCARYVSPVPERLTAPVQLTRERRNDKPADDQAFKIFQSMLAYDMTDLKAAVDSVDDAPHWRRERVSFQAAYGNERVIAYLYLPKNAAPPYQSIVFFPPGGASTLRTPEENWTVLADYIVKSGRALILPVYKGTLERALTAPIAGPNQRRDLDVERIKDLRRSLDYLETRADIDSAKLGYYGFSAGGAIAPCALAGELRFQTAVLISAGMTSGEPPEVDPWNYAPHVKTPVLMLNGRDDFFFPLETSQTPLFEALGTPEKDKRRVLYDGGHVDFISRMAVVQEALDWLDRYLGPVKPQP
jgi:formylglycine-generating enzyme required for sulfatase activity/dienelactone hydrolase